MTNDDVLLMLLLGAIAVAGLAVGWGALRGLSSAAGAVLRVQGRPDHAPFRWLVVGHWLLVLLGLGAAVFGVYVAPLHTIAVCSIVAVLLLYRRLGRKQV